MSCGLCGGTGFIAVAEEPLTYDSASTYEPCPKCGLLEAAAREEKIKEVSQEIGRLTETLSRLGASVAAAEVSTSRLVELGRRVKLFSGEG